MILATAEEAKAEVNDVGAVPSRLFDKSISHASMARYAGRIQPNVAPQSMIMGCSGQDLSPPAGHPPEAFMMETAIPSLADV